MALYEWNVENILTVAKRLDNEKEKMEMIRKNLSNYQNATGVALQGDAGKLLMSNLEQDLKNMQSLILALESQSANLKKIANDYYSETEKQIKAKTSNLMAQIR